MVRPDHGILAVLSAGATSNIDDVAGKLHQNILSELGIPAGNCSVGIGREYPDLADFHYSYLEAKRAAEVGNIVKVLGGTVHHASLGVYGLLAELPYDHLGHSIHPGLRKLLEADDDEALVRTLEVFLDTAGNVRDTATLMCVHRATVYYRLKRIEQVADVDLGDGNDRLALHIGLKVTQLIGMR